MDPVSHAIFGHTLAAAIMRRAASGHGTAVAALVGALAPDVDALLVPAGWDIYLRAHEIGTHSLAGSIPVACVAALGARAFSKASQGHALVAAAWVGVLSHIGLDVVSGARIRVWWPLGAARTHVPLVAMADPWLIAILVAVALALAFTHQQRRVAARGLVVVGAFLVAKAALLAWSLPQVAGEPGPALTRIVEARWASLDEWYVFERTPAMLRQWRIAPGSSALLLSWPAVSESPHVEASRALDTVRNFLDVHELGFVGEVADPGGGTDVLWSDIRFCWPPAAGKDGEELGPVLAAHGPGGSARIACGLWFGGAFDAQGRVVTQLVKVGGWWQRRRPAR